MHEGLREQALRASGEAVTEPPHSRTGALLGAASRDCVLLLLVAAPLALGAVHDWATRPFWFLCFAAGLLSWAGSRLGRARGDDQPSLPGRAWLLAFNALVAFQLLPLPAPLLGFLNPGSLEFHRSIAAFADSYWLTVSTTPRLTLRGLLFLAAVSLVYAAAFREFRERRWARRLAGTVVGVAVAMTLVAFLQKGSSDPGRIYGLWKPPISGAVFGPYANRSFFAGYLVMTIPLTLTFAAEGLARVRDEWLRRGARGITALGEPAGNRAMLNLALAVFLVAGILSAGSRTGVIVLGLIAVVLPLSFGRRLLLPAVLMALVAALGYAWVELGWFVESFQTRSLESSRLAVSTRWGACTNATRRSTSGIGGARRTTSITRSSWIPASWEPASQRRPFGGSSAARGARLAKISSPRGCCARCSPRRPPTSSTSTGRSRPTPPPSRRSPA
jgi:hypothetical protein